jgi:acid stress chaperone HdeB
MKIISAVVSAALLASAVPACADAIDLSSWTCRQFQSASKAERDIILAWLDGYYKSEDDPPVIDTDEFPANGKKLNDYCAAHPDAAFITATDMLFQKE